MGFLDKFKSKKEQEVKESSDATSKAAKEQDEEAQDQSAEVKVDIDALPEQLGDVIVHPYITEKTAILADEGQYTFVVSMDANKVQVKQAVKKMYGVEPQSVNTQIVRGKVVRFGRDFGKRNNWKKAVVTLKEGDSIEIFEGV
jgi:large subunit ribosomal protein L23